MEGARELLLCFEMTAVTELRLLFLHQKLVFFGVMWRVAIGAPDIVLQVRGAAEICVLFAILMAIQAAGTHFLRRNVLEGKYLTLVSASIDVFLARPMTGLAPLPLGPSLGIHGGHEVRRSFIVLVEILSGRVRVAALAHFGTNIERRVGGPLVGLGFLWRARIAPALFRWNERSEETHCCRHHDTHRREASLEQSQLLPRFGCRPSMPLRRGGYRNQNKRAPVKNRRFRRLQDSHIV